MQSKKQTVKYILKAFGACLLVFFLANTLMFVYNRQPGWIERSHGATTSIWSPGTYIVQGQEGYGIHKVDPNGYLNEGTLADDNYVLVVGSSQTEGKEVKAGERYCDILNSALQKEEGKEKSDLLVYNVSMDANYLPKMISGFTALISEFPNSSCIVLEIGTTDYTGDELQRMLIQREYNEAETGEKIRQVLSEKEQLKLLIKEAFPLLNHVKSQYKALEAVNSHSDLTKEETGCKNMELYAKQLKEVFEMLDNLYDGQIIFLYHPTMEITNEGLTAVYEQTTEQFKQLCDGSGFLFVDMTQTFLKAYETDYIVPYGFGNTTLGTGHLNKYGHKMIAESLYQVMTKNN